MLRLGLAMLAAWLIPAAAFAQSVPHAGADDCAVLAEASKALERTGDKQEVPIAPNSFGVDCDWKAFGVAAPALANAASGPYYPGVRFRFARPLYSADGLQATTDYTMGGNGGPRSYFYVNYKCTTQKRRGIWQAATCRTGFST